jgi:Cu(I)/Ag(I) efflux system membrane fusion protein
MQEAVGIKPMSVNDDQKPLPNDAKNERGTAIQPSPDALSQYPESDSQTRWQRAKFFFRAIEVRLRFIGLFIGIGILMAYWTTLEAYWDRWTRPDAVSVAGSSDTEYYCPMHPTVIRPGLEPNGAVPSCPICGMPLSLRKKGAAPELSEGVLTRVQLSPDRVQLAGVKMVPVNYMPLAKEIRTVGYVQYDESRLAEIVTRVSGYLETLYVDKTFEQVDEGQPLAEIYSPDLYSSMQELLLARKHNSTDLIASARQRLKLLGVDNAEIDQVVEGEEATTKLLIRSPLSGQVIEKNVVQGASVESGAVLFKIADLSSVWIEADVYERDLPFLHVGQEIEATVDAQPGKTFAGEISVVYPELNSESRTNRIRVLVDNSELLLRPGMFATVLVQTPMSETEPFKSQLAKAAERPTATDDATLIAFQKICPVTGLKLGSMGNPIKLTVNDQAVFVCCSSCEKRLQESPDEYLAKIAPPPMDTVLSVPEQAVIDTGTHKVVYVEREPGIYEGVEVQLGPRTGGYYPVISGLSAADRIVAAGSFLLDAETRLNPAAASAYFGASGTESGSQAESSSSTSTTRAASKKNGELSSAQLEQIKKLSPDDQKLALKQKSCPVTGEPLGSMGTPIKVIVQGQPVFLCCAGCETEAQEHADETLAKVAKLRGESNKNSTTNPATPNHQH